MVERFTAKEFNAWQHDNRITCYHTMKAWGATNEEIKKAWEAYYPYCGYMRGGKFHEYKSGYVYYDHHTKFFRHSKS